LNRPERHNWLVHACVIVLGSLLLAAVGADVVSRWMTRFTFDEVNPAAALMPPGTLGLPQEHRTYDGDPEVFDVLDLNGSGRLECRNLESGLDCPELKAASRLFDALQAAWLSSADTIDERRLGVSLEEWYRLARVNLGDSLDRFSRMPSPDANSDGLVDYNEFVASTTFLLLNEGDVKAHQIDSDPGLSRREFPGAPLPGRHLLGTDALGRDLLTREIYGLRVSLLVALCATAVSFFFGAFLGLASGFVGGRPDRVFLRVLEVLQALPFIFVVILVAVFTRDVLEVRWQSANAQALVQSIVLFCALGAVQWFSLARYARGLSFNLRNSDFCMALVGMGYSPAQIIFKHLLPNSMVPLLAYTVLLVPTLVLEEAFLSFLGFGVQPPYPSLGILLNEGVAVMEIAPGVLGISAAIIFLLAWSLNIVGEHLSAKRSGGGGK